MPKQTDTPEAGKSGGAADIARDRPPRTLRLAEEIMLLLLDEAEGAFQYPDT